MIGFPKIHTISVLLSQRLKFFVAVLNPIALNNNVFVLQKIFTVIQNVTVLRVTITPKMHFSSLKSKIKSDKNNLKRFMDAHVRKVNVRKITVLVGRNNYLVLINVCAFYVKTKMWRKRRTRFKVNLIEGMMKELFPERFLQEKNRTQMKIISDMNDFIITLYISSLYKTD